MNYRRRAKKKKGLLEKRSVCEISEVRKKSWPIGKWKGRKVPPPPILEMLIWTLLVSNAGKRDTCRLIVRNPAIPQLYFV